MSDRAVPVLDRAFIFDGPDGPRVERIAKATQQLASGDPMKSSAPTVAENGLESPPYDLGSLASLLTGNSIHSRCVKQKATDTLGRGIALRAKEEDDGTEPPAEEEDRWGEFVRLVESDGDGSLKERLTQAHEDFESVGWAVLEVGRNAETGMPDGLWHVPAHTVRAHKDNRRFAQKRHDKHVWFKRYGLEGDVDAKGGGWSDAAIDAGLRGNELIVIKNYSPISTFYGVPDHIPALSALAGWSAQAEFNIRFFGNQAVPSYAVIVEGAELTPALEETIIEHFQRIKGDPARTIVIPVPSVPGVGEAYQPKVRFERLSVEVKEASFRMYRQDAALEICISHGVPPYRVGWPIVGSLGGSTADEMTHIYNDSIVQPRQETWENRLNATLLGESGLDIKAWCLKAAELDVRNEERDLAKAEMLYNMGVVTPNMLARFFGYPERPEGVPGGDDYISQPLNPQGGAGPAQAAEFVAKRYIDEVSEISRLRERVRSIIEGEAPDLEAVA